MNILCNFRGHAFIDGERSPVQSQKFYGGSHNPIGPVENGWQVTIKCRRCGYEHARYESDDKDKVTT